MIAVSHKTFNLAYDENLSSYEMIEELGAVKAEYFTTCIDRIVQGFDIFKEDLKAKGLLDKGVWWQQGKLDLKS